MAMLLQDLATRYFPLEVEYQGACCTNPSLIFDGEGLLVTLKAIYGDTYRSWRAGEYFNITREQVFNRYRLQKPTLVARCDDQLRVVRVYEIDTSELLDITEPRYLKREFLMRAKADFNCCIEDLRLFKHNEHLMVSGIYTEYASVHPSDDYRLIVDRIDQTFIATLENERLTRCFLMPSLIGAKCEVNWIIHQPDGDHVKICTNVQTRAVIDADLRKRTYEKNISSKLEDFRWDGGWSGSTNLVPFQDLFLGVLHRKRGHVSVYQHILFLCDADFKIKLLSEPFSFSGCAVEFCCGLAKDDTRNSIWISFSTWDRTAGILELSIDTLANAIKREVQGTSDLLAHNSFERDYYKNNIDELLECVQGRSNTLASLHKYFSTAAKGSSDLVQPPLEYSSLDDVDSKINAIIQTIKKYDSNIFSMNEMLRQSVLIRASEPDQILALQTGSARTPYNDPAGASGGRVAVRRNELCPCGSGRRYKHCHGRF